jgi:hypothetical protein
MLTGELPYNDPDDIEVIKMQLYAPVPNPRDTDASIPAELGALVARAMAKRQEQRFADIGEFRQAFQDALDRPIERIEEPSFTDEEDFGLPELEQSPSTFQAPPLPLRSPRLSQHLRVPPEPIEFGGPPAATPRRPRITGDPNDAPNAHRSPVTDDQNDDTPRRPRITGDPNVAARRPRAPEILPEASARYQRAPEDPTEQVGPGRRAHVSEEATEQLGSRRQRATEEQVEAPVQGRRSRSMGEPPEALASGKRLRATDEQAEAPAPVRRPRIAGDEGLDRPRGARSRLTVGRLEKASPPGLSQQRQPAGRNVPVEPRPLPPRHGLPQRRSSGKRHLGLAAIGGLIATVLILLLLLTRVLGVSIFPAGFPILGSSSLARISLTVKTTNLHDTFLLTASPQTAQPNASTRVMPDRDASSSANAIRTIATSGLKNNGGTRATGTLHFDNSGFHEATVSSGFIFMTSNNVQIRLNEKIVVPARSNGQDGTLDAPAEAVEPGQAGNIQADALDSPCCNGPVIVRNTAFSGGQDGGVAHLVTQNDLDGVKNELTPNLRQQAAQQLSGQIQPGEVQVGSPGYTVNVTSDQPVGANAAQVTVTVTVTAKVLVYNTRIANDLARQLLSSEAKQSPAIGSGYQLRGSLAISTPTIEQQGSNGQLYLSVSASGLWSYAVTPHDENLWKQNIKGASTTLAQSYLSTRPGIIRVHIDLPFGTDHLPTDETQIVFSLS